MCFKNLLLFLNFIMCCYWDTLQYGYVLQFCTTKGTMQKAIAKLNQVLYLLSLLYPALFMHSHSICFSTVISTNKWKETEIRSVCRNQIWLEDAVYDLIQHNNYNTSESLISLHEIHFYCFPFVSDWRGNKMKLRN